MEHGMDWAKVVLNFGMFVGLAIAAAASAFGIGKAVAAAMEAMARQPEAAPKIQGAMMLGCAFIEALTIYVFVTVLLYGFGIVRF